MVVAPNWLGDAVMALPSIADVRRSRPDATIAVAARPSIAPLFSLVRDVNDVLVMPRRGVAPLQATDTAILLPNSFHAAMQVARAGVHERWGYRGDWRRVLLTRAIQRPSSRLHQIDYYQHLTGALGFAPGFSTPQIEVTEDARAGGRRALQNGGWTGQSAVVAIAPGAAYGSAKRWSTTAFSDLIAGLDEDGTSSVMVGAAADRPVANEILSAVRSRAGLIDLVGRTDIRELAGVLVHCRALVANDSGALHLATSLGVNTVAVFGPTDDRLTAPRSRSPQTVVLTHDTWCRPCGLRECPLDHACMRGVRAVDVLAAARQVL